MTMTIDKSEAMIQALDRYDIRFRAGYNGWQSISCPNEDGHAHGDKNPSARVNLQYGMMRCLGCDMHGSGFDVVMQVENVDFREALKRLGGEAGYVKEESDFLI